MTGRWLLGAGLVVAVAVAAVARWAAPGAKAAAFEVAIRDVPRLEGTVIRYSPAFAKRAGIVVAPAAEATLSPVVTVTGTVVFDPQRTAAVGVRIAGRVRAVDAFEGAEVRPGDRLAEIESVDLGQAQAAVTVARARAAEAIANDEREQQLASAKVSSAREAEQAHAAAASARAELSAAEQRVRVLGGSASRDGSESAESGVLVLRSPIAGRVVESHVSRGQSVEPSLTAFRVTDMSRLWVELAVFERDLRSVREGDPVELAPQTDGVAVIRGTVSHVGDVVDRETRSADVRVVVDNRDESLRPGQSVIARIVARRGADAGPRVAVPRRAVASIDGRTTVFVASAAQGGSSVEARPVRLGAADADLVEVAEGIAPGESVVTDGVFALKSELFR
jgi:cobalt-zinc-cadmium efflux system membrane fusion protein